MVDPYRLGQYEVYYYMAAAKTSTRGLDYNNFAIFEESAPNPPCVPPCARTEQP